MAKDVQFRSENNAQLLADRAVHLLSDIKTNDNMKALFENIRDGLITDEEFENKVTAAKIKLTSELSTKLVEMAAQADNEEYTRTIKNLFMEVGVKTKNTEACVKALYEIASKLSNDHVDKKTEAVLAAVEIYKARPEAVKEEVNEEFQQLGKAIYDVRQGFFSNMFNKKAKPETAFSEALGQLQDAVDTARVQDFNTALNLSLKASAKNAP